MLIPYKPYFASFVIDSCSFTFLTIFQWLVKNINKKVDKSTLTNGPGTAGTIYIFLLNKYMWLYSHCFHHLVYYAFPFGVDKGPSGLTSNSTSSAKVIYPDTSQMVIYDPRQKPGMSLYR